MPIQADGVAFDGLSTDPGGAVDGQKWQNSILGEPRVQRQGLPETIFTAPSHRSTDQLTHIIAETGVVVDVFDADGCLTSRSIRTASPGGVAIRTWDNYTFDAEGCIDGYRLRQFNAIGAVVETLTVSRPAGVWTTVVS